ncbi:MAG: PASTA domain-containing protein [Fibromonadales bacterium]|nr:PASTA domain-containing protein [Fibromonadales bacterium]
MKLIPNFVGRWPVFYAILFWIFAVVVTVVIVNWIVMPIIAGRLAKTMPVPKVVDLPVEEAEAVLKSAGLNVKWAKEGRYSSDIEANHVLIQIPAAGRTVKEKRTIFLTLSKGRQEVGLPDLRGVTLRQAEISLQRLELLPGAKIEGAHASIPRGIVIRTEPEAGQKIRIGSKVNIIISSGNSSGKTLLPSLREMSLSRATAVIDSLGFKLGEITTIHLEDKLPNTVVELSPKPGEYLESGTTINLTVAE